MRRGGNKRAASRREELNVVVASTRQRGTFAGTQSHTDECTVKRSPMSRVCSSSTHCNCVRLSSTEYFTLLVFSSLHFIHRIVRQSSRRSSDNFFVYSALVVLVPVVMFYAVVVVVDTIVNNNKSTFNNAVFNNTLVCLNR